MLNNKRKCVIHEITMNNAEILFLGTNQVKEEACRKETGTLELRLVYNFSILLLTE